MRSSNFYLDHPSAMPGPGDLWREPEERLTDEDLEELREEGACCPCLSCSGVARCHRTASQVRDCARGM